MQQSLAVNIYIYICQTVTLLLQYCAKVSSRPSLIYILMQKFNTRQKFVQRSLCLGIKLNCFEFFELFLIVFEHLANNR